MNGQLHIVVAWRVFTYLCYYIQCKGLCDSDENVSGYFLGPDTSSASCDKGKYPPQGSGSEGRPNVLVSCQQFVLWLAK